MALPLWGGRIRAQRGLLQRRKSKNRKQQNRQLLDHDETGKEHTPTPTNARTKNQNVPFRDSETMHSLLRPTQKTTLHSRSQGSVDQLREGVHRGE